MPRYVTRSCFDDAYYRRYYLDPGTRAVDETDIQRLADFVVSYARRLGLPLRQAIDFGCGVGLWQRCLQRRCRRLVYSGVEASPYAVHTFGWRHGSVVDFPVDQVRDLVICQSVLQYLDARSADRAIRNLAHHCGGLMYFEVVTREDWEQVCDPHYTDGAIYLRDADWYRRRLQRGFINAGGGVWVARSAEVLFYALEQG